jgi:Ion channel
MKGSRAQRSSEPGPVRHDRRVRIHAWQDRIRDPSLTVLLVLYIVATFGALPLAAQGLSAAQVVTDTLLLVALAIVVMLSQRPGAIVSILLGFGIIAASLLFGRGWPPAAQTVLRRGGDIIAFSALTWVVGHAVYAPGRITSRRLQGAAVVYLSVAMIFAAAFSLIWELRPGAFAHLNIATGGEAESAAMMYFSLATLTTTGYGDIVAVDPFARGLANLESVIGVFYVAITVARLVTLELEDRRR